MNHIPWCLSRKTGHSADLGTSIFSAINQKLHFFNRLNIIWAFRWLRYYGSVKSFDVCMPRSQATCPAGLCAQPLNSGSPIRKRSGRSYCCHYYP